MQVFISWSGDQSRSVAEALEKAIRHIVRGASTFISTHDIDPGERWETRVSEELEKSNHAVLCITRDNQTAPWLNYEAGALGRLVGTSKVIPYTLGFPPSELKSGPLARFQGVQNDEPGTWNLMKSLNQSSASPDDDGFLREDFDVWFPRLRDTMTELLASNPAARRASASDERELLLEIRQDIRRLIHLNHSRASTGVHDAIELLEQALRDPLTRLQNRQAFSARTAELAASNATYVIAFLDLDRFKKINDGFGHKRGDEVLVAVAGLLKERLTTADLVARLGGDEFAAIFRERPPEAVGNLLGEVVSSLPRETEAAGHPAVTASCGVSSDRIEDGTLKLRDADKAMFRAKQEGGGRVVLSD
jgi:diguanylate cyclase (GGDEF)-like protein